ncbi:MAG: peptide transporter, partial [bacterium]
IIYALINYLGLPVMLFYGFVGGITAVPGNTLMIFLGALLGRYYFAKRFGEHRWRAYTPVLAAGYGCGWGLVSMICIALTLIAKSVSYMPY